MIRPDRTWTLALLAVALTAAAAAQAPGSLNAYEPSAEYPWGRPNPEAPSELQQMAFMIGDFHCSERSRQRDGSWNELQTLWRARYFMNGWAIHDQNFKGSFTATNLRFYDPQDKVWRVSWFRTRPYGESTGWIGRRNGDSMVMESHSKGPESQDVLTRLTFFDISDAAYKWKAERFADGKIQFGGAFWEISCRRR